MPTKVAALDDVNVVFIEAGASHSIAIDDQGVVWTWGDNGSGQLGHYEDNLTPQRVIGLPR